jgi:hypothetical protein
MLGGRNVKKLAKPILIFIMCTLSLAMVCNVTAQKEGNNVETFLDSDMLGGTIQVNATTQTRPKGNLTLWLCLTPQTGVHLENLSYTLDVYGFRNGTTPKMIGNMAAQNLNLPSETTKEYDASESYIVPEDIWGLTFGNITLTYSISFLETPIPMNVITGFYMTNVENTFLEKLESQLSDLQQNYTTLQGSYNQLNDAYYNLTVAYLQLNQTFVQLQQNYTTLQGSMNTLDNTRQVAVILAITTVFFVATTIFLVMRRPKESW